MIKRIALGIILFLFVATNISAQKTFEVIIISDASEQENHFFEDAIKSEITALLASQYTLNFTEVYTSGVINTINNEIVKIYTENQVDILIGTGIITSKLLADQNTYPIPTIASIQLSNSLDEPKVDLYPTFQLSNFPPIHPSLPPFPPFPYLCPHLKSTIHRNE